MGKLKYDFNTIKPVEVYINDRWVRISEREFRSWNGIRRIKSNSGDYEKYNGPLYLYGTNTIINPKDYIKNRIAGFEIRGEAKRTCYAKI